MTQRAEVPGSLIPKRQSANSLANKVLRKCGSCGSLNLRSRKSSVCNRAAKLHYIPAENAAEVGAEVGLRKSPPIYPLSGRGRALWRSSPAIRRHTKKLCSRAGLSGARCNHPQQEATAMTAGNTAWAMDTPHAVRWPELDRDRRHPGPDRARARAGRTLHDRAPGKGSVGWAGIHRRRPVGHSGCWDHQHVAQQRSAETRPLR